MIIKIKISNLKNMLYIYKIHFFTIILAEMLQLVIILWFVRCTPRRVFHRNIRNVFLFFGNLRDLLMCRYLLLRDI